MLPLPPRSLQTRISTRAVLQTGRRRLSRLQGGSNKRSGSGRVGTLTAFIGRKIRFRKRGATPSPASTNGLFRAGSSVKPPPSKPPPHISRQPTFHRVSLSLRGISVPPGHLQPFANQEFRTTPGPTRTKCPAEAPTCARRSRKPR